MYRGSLPREAKKGFLIKQSLIGYIGAGEQKEGEGKHTDAILCLGIDILNSVFSSFSSLSIACYFCIKRFFDSFLGFRYQVITAYYFP